MTDSAETSKTRASTLRLTFAAWGILIVGIAVRCGLQVLKVQNLSTDPDAYVRLSRSLAAGTGFSIDGTLLPTAFRPPLFPMLLAAPQSLGLSTIFSIALVHLISSVLVLVATWKLANLMGLSNRAALLPLGLIAFDPLLLLYSTLPMTEVPSSAFVAWAAVCSVSFSQSLSAGQLKSALISGVMAGACFGFGGLCRPILFVACFVVSGLFVLTSFLARRKASCQSEPPWLPQSIAIVCVPAAVAGVILSPWVIRNAVQLKSFIPATTHGGYTLLLGNNPVFYTEVVDQPGHPRWEGNSLDHWNQALAKEMRELGISPVDEVRRDRWMYDRAKQNITSDPDSFRNSCLLRLRRLVALIPSGSNDLPYVARIGIGLFYGLVFLGVMLQLVSLVRAPRSSMGESLILWCCVLAFLLIHAFYWTNTRMRAPLMPVLASLSAMGFTFFTSAIGWQHHSAKDRSADEAGAGA